LLILSFNKIFKRQRHIWFVDNGKTEGFMPCSALTPYKEMYTDGNLIEFENVSSSNAKNLTSSDSSSNRVSLLNEALRNRDLINLVKEEVRDFLKNNLSIL
jgi:hypothetical protein